MKYSRKSEFKKFEKSLSKEKKRSNNDLLKLLQLAAKEDLHYKVLEIGQPLSKQITDKKTLANILYKLGTAHFKLGDAQSGREFYEQSIKVDNTIDNAEAFFGLATVYLKQEMYTAFETIFPKLTKWEKYHESAQMMAIESAGNIGNKTLLVSRIKALIPYGNKLHRKHFGSLVTYMLGANLISECEAAIFSYEKANKIKRWFDRARVKMHVKAYEDALVIINEGIAEFEGKVLDPGLSTLFYLKGSAEDKLGRYENAFHSFKDGAKLVNKKDNKVKKSRVAEKYSALVPKLKYQQEQKGTSKNLVFILGFPRSGTTLLDNILDTQDALVLSERNIFNWVVVAFDKMGYKYPQDILKLDENDIVTLRTKYFDIISQQGFDIDSVNTIIEKGPHLTEDIPFIKLLFPQAKIITCLRHPLDVTLSCFQKEFVFNSFNAHLITLGDICNRYKVIYSLLERYENNLGIEVYHLRYEDLVADMETEIEKVFSYIGLDFNDSYKLFDQHAAKKYVTSASQGQTDQKIYSSAVYKWKNYEALLAPYKERLTYFIDKFGYVD